MRSFFTLLLRAFPRPFREEFGAGMRDDLLLDYGRARSAGRARAALFLAAAAWDVVASGLRERASPSWVRRDESNMGRWEMRGAIESWTKELVRATRTLLRDPGFTVVAVGTLGLAIGANAGIFSVVDTVLLEPLPYAYADRLVHVAATAPGSDLPDEFSVSNEFYVHYREESELLEDVAGYDTFTHTLRTADRVERVLMGGVTTSLFETLGATPLLGRLPTEEDESRVVVISHGLWTTWFGADPAAIGRTAEVGGESRTIIGVMGPDFWFPGDGAVLWIPRVIQAEDIVPGRFGLPLVARAAPGATPEAVAEELTRLARRLPERFGGSAAYARLVAESHRAVVRPFRTELLGNVASLLQVLMGAVGIVLLIACANVANLFVVRAERRQRALAVRVALGAGRAQLMRSLMSEAWVVAVAAGALAVLLAWLGVPLFLAVAPPEIPRLDEVRLTAATLLFTLGAAVFCALLCGLLPALRASRPDLARLREAGRGATRRSRWGRDALVVAQTSLALVLLIGSALLVRSFWALRSVDPGYETEDVLTFQFAPEQSHLVDGPSWAAFHLDFVDRLRALPGVEAVGIVENVPLDEGFDSGRYLTDETASAGDAALLRFTFTAGDYFEAMEIDVVRGRAFTRSDHVSALGNVLVSSTTAELLWPGEDPIGKRIRNRDWGPEWETVVGVVEDILQYGLRDVPEPIVYYPLVRIDPAPYPLSSPGYVVRAARAEDLAPEVRALVREVAPEAPMYRVHTMASLAARSLDGLPFTMLTLGIASVLAVVLGAVGLFGVLSYVVADRTKEIGLRMALGACASEVRRMVVAQGGRVTALGVVLGVLAALAGTRVLERLLFGVAAVDVVTFVAMSAVMLVVALLASYLPARRASSVDPVRSLAAE